MDFPWLKTHSPNLGDISKPIIPVTVEGPHRSVRVSMLLDSGADISMIPYSVGRVIGLKPDMSQLKEVRGIGEGGVAYILSQLSLTIGNEETSARVGWSLIEEVPIILGRLDVFRNFSIDFREFEDKIVVLRRPRDRVGVLARRKFPRL